jgi:hypothetical protein
MPDPEEIPVRRLDGQAVIVVSVYESPTDPETKHVLQITTLVGTSELANGHMLAIADLAQQYLIQRSDKHGGDLFDGLPNDQDPPPA